MVTNINYQFFKIFKILGPKFSKSKTKIKNFKDTIYSRGQIEVELGAESVPEISDLGLIDSTNRNKLENYGA